MDSLLTVIRMDLYKKNYGFIFNGFSGHIKTRDLKIFIISKHMNLNYYSRFQISEVK